MFGHRFASQFASQSDLQPIRPASFVMCPLGLGQALAQSQPWAQQHVYQMALAEALAVARPRSFDPEIVFSSN